MALTDVKSEQIQSSVALAGSPTTTTQSASDNSTKIATTAYVETAVANLVASAPSALNTLDELAAALNDDANFASTITTSIAAKLPLTGGTLTGALTGTSATFSGSVTSQSIIATNASGTPSTFNGANNDNTLQVFAGTTSNQSFGLLVDAGTSSSDYAAEFRKADNTTIMRIRGDGNVGLGTANPTTGRLHLRGAGTSNSTNAIFAENSSGAGLFAIRDGGEAFILGNVGIGTSSPDTLLELVGADPILTIRDSATSSATANATLRLAESGASDSLGSYWDIKSVGGQLQFIDNWNEGGGTGTRVVINDSGYVGIGTTNPAQKFVVAEGTNQHGIELAPGSLSYIQAYDRATSDYGNLKIDAEILMFGTNNGAERMRIDTSGNVGIGKTAGAVRMDVETNLNGNLAGQFKNTHASGSYGIKVMGGHDSSNYSAVFTDKDNTTLMMIRGNGTVGIGTTNPIAQFAVGGGGRRIEIQGTDGVIRGFDRTASWAQIDFEASSYTFDTGGSLALTLDSSGLLKFPGGSAVDNANTNFNINLPATGGITMGSAYTFANIHGDSGGSVYIKANAYPANTGSSTFIKLRTANASGGTDSDVTVAGGNIAFASGQGIDFSATGNGTGSMGSELLDDYEEGTWVPVLIAGTTNPTGGGAQNPQGSYTKIGNRVFATYYVGRTWTNTPAGAIYVSGLPFTINNTGANSQYHYVATYNVNFGGGMTMGVPSNGGTTVQLYSVGNNSSWSAINWTTHTNGSTIYLSGSFSYIV